MVRLGRGTRTSGDMTVIAAIEQPVLIAIGDWSEPLCTATVRLRLA